MRAGLVPRVLLQGGKRPHAHLGLAPAPSPALPTPGCWAVPKHITHGAVRCVILPFVCRGYVANSAVDECVGRARGAHLRTELSQWFTPCGVGAAAAPMPPRAGGFATSGGAPPSRAERALASMRWASCVRRRRREPKRA